MTGHREHLRLKDPSVPFSSIIYTLSDDNIGVINVLKKLRILNPALLLELDTKHLYGEHIWEVFADVCGRDLERFKYHLEMELPCQICGELSHITGPFRDEMSEEERDRHVEARSYGEPGSYWALKNPPTNPDYKYPIKVNNGQCNK